MASQQQQYNAHLTPEDEDDDEVLLYDLYAPNQQPHSPSQQVPLPHNQYRVQNAYPSGPRSQTPHPANNARSATSLTQYAMFPGPMRSMTPAPGTFYQHNPLAINLTTTTTTSSSSPQQAHSSGLETPDPQMSGKKVNACNLCNASFERRFDLKRHMHTHSEHKEFVCPRCDKALARSDSLQRHQNVCKGPRSP